MTTRPDPFAAAIARADHTKQTLRVMAGKLLTGAEVADYLGVTSQAVDKLREQKELLAVDQNAIWLYPAFQFDNEDVHAGIKQVLSAYDGHDPWYVLDTLLARDDTLGDRSLLDAIRDGDHTAVERNILQDLNDGYA